MVDRSPPTQPPPPPLSLACQIFASRLGWMALLGNEGVVTRLLFGFARREDAAHAVAAASPGARMAGWHPALAERLQEYAGGGVVDFEDVAVRLPDATPFRRRILDCCRTIPFGTTWTYSQLAACAGFGGAARAVGNCMASNPVPLIIPCHRVVAVGGLGGYSSPQGLSMKQRLLKLENLGSQPGERSPRRDATLASNAHGVRRQHSLFDR